MKNNTRDISLSVDQINKIIAGLHLLPAEPEAPGFETAAPHELIEMFECALAEPSDVQHDFTA